jgi:hypothetical protein
MLNMLQYVRAVNKVEAVISEWKLMTVVFYYIDDPVRTIVALRYINWDDIIAMRSECFSLITGSGTYL